MKVYVLEVSIETSSFCEATTDPEISPLPVLHVGD